MTTVDDLSDEIWQLFIYYIEKEIRYGDVCKVQHSQPVFIGHILQRLWQDYTNKGTKDQIFTLVNIFC